jgi:hypothetical protein
MNGHYFANLEVFGTNLCSPIGRGRYYKIHSGIGVVIAKTKPGFLTPLVLVMPSETSTSLFSNWRASPVHKAFFY